MNEFNLGLVQMKCAPDRATNLERAVEKVNALAARGAQIIVLPELFLGPYFCQKEEVKTFDLAEPIPGPSSEVLSRTAKDAGVVIIASLFERRAAGVYHNTAAVFDADGSLLGLYRKMHIPDDPLYLEKYYFTPGDLGFRVFDTRFAKVGVLVCWDQWYPEAARLTALRGAEVLVYPTAIGWHPKEKSAYGVAQHQAWETIQRAHAVANGVYVASVNRVGHEGAKDGGLEFWGASFISDPFGTLMVRAGHADEELLTAVCDRRKAEDIRRNWPFLRDRRIDAYDDLSRRMID